MILKIRKFLGRFKVTHTIVYLLIFCMEKNKETLIFGLDRKGLGKTTIIILTIKELHKVQLVLKRSYKCTVIPC